MDGILVNIHTPSGESWRPSELSRCTHIAESTSSATVLLICCSEHCLPLSPGVYTEIPLGLPFSFSAAAPHTYAEYSPPLRALTVLTQCRTDLLGLPYCSLLQWTLHKAVTRPLHRNPCRYACVQLSAAAPHTSAPLIPHTASALWRISPLSTLTWQLEVVMATCLLTFA